MSNNKQSSIEWLEECLSIHFTHEQKMQFEGLFQQAKAMHKQEIMDAFGVGCQVEASRLIGYHKMAEQYYNEKYGS